MAENCLETLNPKLNDTKNVDLNTTKHIYPNFSLC